MSEDVPNNRQAYLPFAGAGAVAVVIVAAIVLWPRSDVAQPADAAGCPKTYLGTTSKAWVPANPVGVDATTTLTPVQTPLHVTVCAYLSPTGSTSSKLSSALTGSRKLDGDLSTVTRTLSRQRPGTLPPGCKQDGVATDRDNYLVRVTFRSGTVWVATPGDHCLGSTNGDFVSTANLRVYADVAYRSGRWSPTNGGSGTPSVTAPSTSPS